MPTAREEMVVAMNWISKAFCQEAIDKVGPEVKEAMEKINSTLEASDVISFADNVTLKLSAPAAAILHSYAWVGFCFMAEKAAKNNAS